MTKYLTATKKFVVKLITGKEEGAALAEYGLLLALIAVVCLLAIGAVGKAISTVFNTIAGTI